MAVKTYLRGTCKKCRATLRVELDGHTAEQLRARLAEIQGYECPGQHVELSPMLDGFDWDPTPVVAEEPLSDEEFGRILVVKYGRERLFHLGQDELGKQLGIRSLHEVSGLEHMGFGEFFDARHMYERFDSPRGARFYVQQDI